MPNKHLTTHHKKRRGHHHKRTKEYHRVYLPYLPLVVAVLISIVISGWRPTGNTLAYATNTSIGGLHSATNSQRSANGQPALALNSQLNSAAQAKANDMTSRNYWSHNTPEGQEPWIFVDAAGYKYLKAGENLAYGFTDSNGTVTGWMNSPTHKSNMLDAAFTEVGFGFANAENYNSSGQQTVVVAMYGKPQTLGASSPAPTAPVAPAPTAAIQQAAPIASTPAPVEATPLEMAAEAPAAEPAKETIPVAFTTETPGLEPASLPVTRVAALAGNNAAFAVGLMIGLAVMAYLMKHGLALKRLIRNSENFVLHHPLFDSSIVGLIIVGITLLQTSGFIK